MKRLIIALLLLGISGLFHSLTAQSNKGEKVFIKNADESLTAMESAANEIAVKGVAIVAFIPGEEAQTWISKMKVVGDLTNSKSNLLGVASSKAAEMADTFRDSGSGIREPLKGEYGYKGGVIQKVEGGYILAVFSGATGEQDVAIARKGLAYLATHFH